MIGVFVIGVSVVLLLTVLSVAIFELTNLIKENHFKTDNLPPPLPKSKTNLLNPVFPPPPKIDNLLTLEKEVSELPDEEYYAFQKRWIEADATKEYNEMVKTVPLRKK